MTVAVQRKRLASGHTKSCGCLQRENARRNVQVGQALAKTHGYSHTQAWLAWMRMRVRCRSRTSRSAARYVGRGIKVDPRWDASFEAFLADVGQPPSPAHSLDRIDGNGHYVPGNVRWATVQQQNRNKADNVVVEWQGRRMVLAEAVEAAGLPYHTVWHRIVRAGWPAERALTEPVRRGK